MEPLNRKRIPLVSGPEETMTLLPLPPGDEHPERFQLSTWHGHDNLLFSGSVDRAGLEQLVMAGAELLGLAVPTGLYTLTPVITDPATGALIRPDVADTYVALIEDSWSTVEAVSDFLTARRATPPATLGTTTLERLANDPAPERAGYGAMAQPIDPPLAFIHGHPGTACQWIADPFARCIAGDGPELPADIGPQNAAEAVAERDELDAEAVAKLGDADELDYLRAQAEPSE